MVEYYKQDEIKNYIKANLYNYDLSDKIDIEQIHQDLFNVDYFIIGYYHCEKWLNNNVFECIEVIKEYEEDMLGEVQTDFSNSENVCNMYAYIVGERVIKDTIKEYLFDKCYELITRDKHVVLHHEINNKVMLDRLWINMITLGEGGY